MAERPENNSPDTREHLLSELVRAYASALLTGDEIEAEAVIRDAIEAKLGMATIDEEIIAPALWLVGELWQRGEISVADEHLATEICIRVLALQREAQRVANARRGRRILLATPMGERHVVALQMVGNLLREAGYAVVMLGADVPPGALAAAAARHEAQVICLSTTVPGGADQVLIAIHEVQRAFPAAAFVVGGRGLTARVRAQPGIDVCHRVSEAVRAIDAMVQRADLN